MPELPDVETFRKDALDQVLRKRISGIRVSDKRLLRDTSPQLLARRLKDQRLTTSVRRGKCLFAGISSDGWLVLHFGMTGSLEIVLSGDDPDYTSVSIEFGSSERMAITSKRILGQIRIIDDLDAFIDSQDLGPDALDEHLNRRTFADMLSKRSGRIKSLLMNQSFVAGIGNVYADEVLFQAGIHPASQVKKFGSDDAKRLYEAMRRTLRTCANRRAVPERFPKSYLLRHAVTDGQCPNCSGTISKLKLGGRPSYLCTRCQRRV